MAPSLQAQQQSARDVDLPIPDLTIAETLRVMDVARELRDQRESAEAMFQREGVRARLRDKLMRQAKVLHENVTEAEIDAAIDQYLSTQHTYQDPQPGLKSFLAHCWVWRARIAVGITAAAMATALTVGSYWFLFAG